MGKTLHINLLMENWVMWEFNSLPQLRVVFFL